MALINWSIIGALRYVNFKIIFCYIIISNCPRRNSLLIGFDMQLYIGIMAEQICGLSG